MAPPDIRRTTCTFCFSTILLLYVGTIDLLQRALVAPNNDGRLVDVEEEVPVLRVQIPERPLLKRQVEGRVRPPSLSMSTSEADGS